ncbi:WUSCHEL-related homeobox 11 [Dichanthelium oligosanthes]|uniref:WUSCHEL-related homeobox 11 n=1 Tax=Dichanthelium oligosanthes TaxID=888268 RepID=A0A1E5WGP7_9POAL|nr:WUSCHEL-related homeobox 11 [Dichanthelium oligosanthes]
MGMFAHGAAYASITVFINGVATEVPRGPIDLRSMFGQDVMLVHSTGGLLPVNEYGILMQNLQMGESYFLVSIAILVRTSIDHRLTVAEHDRCYFRIH